MSSAGDAILTAQYTAPSATKIFSAPLVNLPSSDSTVQEKTAYLSDLRSKVSELQDGINIFLTQKMEEDKAKEAGQHTGNRNEDREEEMYGEEDAEDEG